MDIERLMFDTPGMLTYVICNKIGRNLIWLVLMIQWSLHLA